MIGGTSHAGKSTLARALADHLGGEVRSTDHLGRHPGRPWPAEGREVAAHVVDHYRSLSERALLADVLRYYRGLRGKIKEIVERHAQSAQPLLVLEGSALWPTLVGRMGVGGASTENVTALWLTGREETFRTRILAESAFEKRSAEQQVLIEKFLARTLLYNRHMMRLVAKRELPFLEIESAGDLAGLRAEVERQR